ncbi:MAG TPA: HDIG domain-containing protein [Hydrogenispora sp.]|nr:HDIG domain-containing protein [Hydrogenispora sp.]
MAAWQRVIGLFRRRLNKTDRQLAESYLDEAGLFLFNQMSYADQKHAVTVARYLLSEKVDTSGANMSLLIQGALLHDVGKVKGEISWWNRIRVGLIRRYLPRLRDKRAKRGEKGLGHALYVDLHHPDRGAYMAQSLGVDPSVVFLIRHHHDDAKEPATIELALLQSADAKN